MSSWDVRSACIAQWKMNEDAENTTVVDATGNGHTGTLSVNTNVAHAVGLLGNCFDFAGERYIDCGDDDAFSFGNGTNDSPFSIASWINVVAGSATQHILSKYNVSAVQKEWFCALQSSEKFYLQLYDEINDQGQYRTTDDALSAGKHFVVANYNGVGGANAADGITLYVDTVAVNASSVKQASYVAMSNTSAKLFIGAFTDSEGNVDNFFKDKIDNTMLFNRVLTQTEINGLYNGGVGTENLFSRSPLPTYYRI